VALFGAPIVFLLGTILFSWAISGKIPIAQVAGIVLLALLSFFGANASAAALSAGASALLVIVAAWETRWESGAR
jgi:low temperature requirement protein LtrA